MQMTNVAIIFCDLPDRKEVVTHVTSLFDADAKGLMVGPIVPYLGHALANMNHALVVNHLEFTRAMYDVLELELRDFKRLLIHVFTVDPTPQQGRAAYVFGGELARRLNTMAVVDHSWQAKQ
jgi:tRNA A58 N-methylase Trm61